MKTSVMVTAWNESILLLEKCLAGIEKNKELVGEVVFVINSYEADLSHTKNLVEFINNRKDVTRFVVVSQNIGIARAWNIGAQLCEGELLMILNGDFILGSGAVSKLLKPFENETIGIVGIGGVRDGRKTDEEGLCDNVHGSGIVIRRSVFIKLGGSDEAFSPICDEVELCSRLWKQGYGSYIAPAVPHFHSPGISRRIHEDILYMGRKIDRAQMEKNNSEYKLSLPWLGRLSYKIKNPISKYKL
ncbi:MAG: glycosyltransferase [Deltaproteobacteria bacterium]|nr:glycosyltransferase [Deltaproteobacteria bacterium]